MNEQDLDVISAMQRFGGSFTAALAEAASRADSQNLARLKAAFPELWEDYADLARRREEARVRATDHNANIARFYDERNRGGECGD